MNAPTPVTEADFLRSKLSQALNGFVSQNAGQPQGEAEFTVANPAAATAGKGMHKAH